MLRYALRRLALFPLLLGGMYAAAVLLIMAAPGEGLETGERDLPPEVLAAKRAAFNYDQPWYQRYFWTWPRRLIWTQDLPAHQYEDWTVVEILRGALPISMQLGLVALALAIFLGVGAGLISVLFRGRALDHIVLSAALVGVTLPTFVIGSALLLGLGVWWKIAPIGGWGRPAQVFLPAFTLALPYAAYIARLLRTALLETYAEPYIRTARAKGLSERQVLFRHAFPNALLPVLSYLGPAAAAIFTGSFVVEKIFAIPGMGTHVVESINNRDQSLILAIVLIYGSLLAGLNLIVDLLYGVVDPRVRVGRAL